MPEVAAPYAPRAWDEAIDERGNPRPGYAQLLESLAASDLASIETEVARRLRERGVRFSSSAGEEIFHVDPVPRIVEHEDWERLRAGLRQRAAALNAFIVDVYGERRIVAEGDLPEQVIETADHYERALIGHVNDEQPAPIIGFDLVRGADGHLTVLEDNARTPSGFAYAVAARAALARVLPVSPPSLADPEDAVELMRHAIAAAKPAWGIAILLADGPSNSAWFEHRELARRLELPLVTPDALRRDGARLHLHVDGEQRRVALAYRRTDEDRLFDEHECPTPVGELMLEPIREGGLVVWNAFGAGVADDKLVHCHVEEMIRFYLGEEPLLPSVRSYDLSSAETREEVRDRLAELVIKPRAGLGGQGVVICAHATAEDRARIAREIDARPRDYVAQETIELSTHPTVAGDQLEPRHVDLRAFTIGDELAPAALTRFAREHGALVVNSSEGGGAKDTWILS